MTWLVLIGAIGVAGISWINLRLALWWVWLLIPTYLVPVLFGTIPTNLFEISVLIVAAVALVRHPRAAVQSMISVVRGLGWPLGLLVVGLIIGVVVSPDLRLSLGIFKGWFVIPLLLLWLTSWQLRFNDLNRYISALLLSTLPLSGMAVGQVITQQFITIDGRASGWFVSANYLSMYLVPILLLGLIVIQTGRSWQRRLAYVAWGLGLVALYFSFSFGGWLALSVALLLWGIVGSKWWRKWWPLAPIGLVMAVFTQIGDERFERMLDLSQRSSVSVRWQVWQTAGLMIREHWLAGIGLGQYRDQYLAYASRLFTPPWETAILHAHNVYLQFWINAGLLGLVGWIWLVVNFFRRGLVRLTPATTGLMTAMVAIVVHGVVDTTYWKNDLAAIFWLTFAMMTIATRIDVPVADSR